MNLPVLFLPSILLMPCAVSSEESSEPCRNTFFCDCWQCVFCWSYWRCGFWWDCSCLLLSKSLVLVSVAIKSNKSSTSCKRIHTKISVQALFRSPSQTTIVGASESSALVGSQSHNHLPQTNQHANIWLVSIRSQGITLGWDNSYFCRGRLRQWTTSCSTSQCHSCSACLWNSTGPILITYGSHKCRILNLCSWRYLTLPSAWQQDIT